jgi:hypothetical protein
LGNGSSQFFERCSGQADLNITTEVINGHLRLKAARKLGITDIPIILCDEWTPAQVKAFRLMVNRSATST